MPILVDPSLQVVDTGSAAGVVPTLSYSSAVWTWTSASGRVRSLTADHPYLRPGGIRGHMAAPVVPLYAQPPTLDGGIFRGQRIDPRDVQVALMAHTRDSTRWRDTYRQTVADFDTTSGAGVLTVHNTDGTRRSLSCRYVSGLESPVDGEPGVVKIGTFVIELRAYDPWWYGPAESRRFSAQSDTPIFPGPPFTIMPTELAGSPSVVDNPGDVAAYPVWTITGPASQVTFGNSTGDSFTITRSMGLGDTVTIDTDPRVNVSAKITDQDGVNLWGTATSDYPNLWALPSGESLVTVDVSGASTDTLVTLQFNPRYRTA